MNTPSHFLMTAALRKIFNKKPIRTQPFLWGSIMPDIPLYFLAIGAYVYFLFFLGWDIQKASEHIWGTLYFNHPIWIFLHNLLHAPILLVSGLLWILFRKGKKGFVASGWAWFLLACLIHSMVDVVTHHDDGPLLLFPFDWNFRFSSPISYWDSKHYGMEFAFCEIVLDLVIVLYLYGSWVLKKLKAR